MKLTPTLLAAVLFTAAQANAALVPALGGQLVNDTDLNVTWLANANLAATNTFGVSGIYSNGTMTWSTAQNWIAAMNAANYLGYSDWRLPTALQSDASCQYQSGVVSYGYNCTGSEMGHLYYNELGNLGYYNTAGTYQPGYGLVNDPANPNDESLFSNLQSSSYYWSGTVHAYDPAWVLNFGFNSGHQYASQRPGSLYALAVRPGQVVATPLPGAAWLLGSGLLGLIGLGRRRVALR